MKPAKQQSASKPKAKAAARTSKPHAAAGASEQASGNAASRLIDERIRALGDWRGKTLAQMRKLILAVDPAIIEEVKWRGTPVWSRDGILCTGETYAKVVKLTFAHGAKLPDPKRLFNSSLDGNTRRAIDIREGEKIDAAVFKALIKAAVAHNGGNNKSNNALAKKSAAAKKTPAARTPKEVKLLSGGNPQIAKGDGDAPVQAYIAAMPGWKQDFGRRLDSLIMRNAPKARKAVKWNSPFYGSEGQGWFLSFHVFTRYVKVTFFNGASLRPVPPGAGKDANARWIDVYEDDKFDEAQMAKWIKQAAAIPGWNP